MPIDPYNPVHLQRLQQSMEHSRRVLEPWRQNREKLVREFVGSRYSDNGPNRKKLYNLLNQTAETYTIALVANRPRALVTSHFQDLNFFAEKFQIHLNNLLEEVRVEETLRQVVLDAFFSMGIVKIFMGDSGEHVEVPNPDYHGNPENPVPESILVDPGKPTIERISLDDWFHDTTATRWDRIKYCGDYYRISFDKLKDPMFDQEVASTLQPTKRYDSDNDDEGYGKASDITRNEQADWDEVVDMIDLADIWLPYEKLVVTLPRKHSRNSKPLAVREWDGPEQGPYRTLGFLDVPDNLMPSAPSQNILDLEQLLNSLLRKLERQARRQKTITSAPTDAQESIDKLKRSSDGDGVIFTNDPNNVRELSFGGINQSNMAFAITVGELFNKAAGNPEALAGLGPQSSTASQDQMIQDAVSKKQAKMQEKVVDFTAKVCRDLGWLLWVDAYKTQPGIFEIPDANVSLQADWTPEDREGDFAQYLFNIEPYSMAYKSPNQRAEELLSLIQNIYLPALPYIQQQGGQIDWQELTHILADLRDNPRLKSLIRFNGPPLEQHATAQDAMAKPTHTHREYTRHNVSTGGTPQSRNNTLVQTLMAGDGNAPVNQDQMAGLFQ